MNKNRLLLKGINIVFIANVINLIINSISNFVLPKYLPVRSYAVIKEYQLYLSYVGLLHLGYIEGVYIKYGGTNYSDLDKDELRKISRSMILLQITVIIILVAVFYKFNLYVLVLAVISAFPINMATMYKLLYQATGEFKKYGRVMNITALVTFFINILLLFVFRTYNPYIYIIGYIAMYVAIWLLLNNHDLGFKRKRGGISLNLITENINTGFLLMLGNFASIIQTTMDRVFVKNSLDYIDFALYSFAVSMENLINLLITPLTVTLYNYFCKNKYENFNRLIKYILIIDSIIIASFFILKTIIYSFLSDYKESLVVISILYSSQFIYVLVKGIFLNLYKALNLQRKYFLKLLVSIIAGCLLNIILFAILQKKEAYAIATLISAVIWLIMCGLDCKEIGMGTREYIYSLYILVVFITCSLMLNPFKGFCLYVILVLISMKLILNMQFKNEIIVIRNVILEK